MNMQSSLNQELMLYVFKMSHKTAKASIKISSAEHEDAVDHSTVTLVTRTIFGRDLYSYRGLSGEYNSKSIRRASFSRYFHNLDSYIRAYRIVIHITKIWQNAWFNLVILFYEHIFKTFYKINYSFIDSFINE